MRCKFNKSFSSIVLIMAFSVAVIFSSNSADAQSLWKIDSNGQPPSGSIPPQDNSSSSKTPIFIIMGAAVAGFVLYKLVFQNNDEPVDSADTNSSSLLLPTGSQIVHVQSESIKSQDTPPVNLFLGIRRDNYNTANEERTYVLGVSFKF